MEMKKIDMEYKLEDVKRIAVKILADNINTRLFWLTGDLGAGKTTLVTAFCKELGVLDSVSSPTFPIINEYITDKDDLIYHIDLYRLKDQEEALNIGIEDYLYQKNYTFIEWPEIIEDLLPEDILRIHIQNIDNSTRKILFL
ncbi:MAG: tRNA threonylcarbamoyladenosine biosynthesis protein TsaE [Maribacter sp.]|jgi:tRNA threonylcarbamoyladenosine biosynthesis protein TsaE